MCINWKLLISVVLLTYWRSNCWQFKSFLLAIQFSNLKKDIHKKTYAQIKKIKLSGQNQTKPNRIKSKQGKQTRRPVNWSSICLSYVAWRCQPLSQTTEHLQTRWRAQLQQQQQTHRRQLENMLLKCSSLEPGKGKGKLSRTPTGM